MIRRWSLRVVSLLPSATEIVCALGAGPELVGVLHECDHPAEVAQRPPLISSRRPGGGGDGELDRSVRELLRAALAIYHLDADLLPELDPGLVVTFTIQATPTGPTRDRHFPSRASKMAPRRARLTASLPPRRRGACRDGRLLGVGQRPGSGSADHAPLDPRVPARAAFEVAR